MIKSRQDFLKHVLGGWLPQNALSLHRFFSGPKGKKTGTYIGGRLSNKVLQRSCVLGEKPWQVTVTFHKACTFTFAFREEGRQKTILLSQVFKWLKPGDHLLVFLETAQQARHLLKQREIKNVRHVGLAAVSRQRKLNSPLEPDIVNLWFLFLEDVKKGLKTRGLVPVETPTLNEISATEPHLDVFETHDLFSGTGKTKTLYLSTSPEVSLKRLLCRGWTDFYEIKKCFRKNEYGRLHNAEFTLLEWYRAYTHLNTLMDDLEFLFLFLLRRMKKRKKIRFLKYRMKDLFKKHLSFDLTPVSSSGDFKRKLKIMGVPFGREQGQSDLFHLLFLNGVEPFLNKEHPVVIQDYPPFEKAYSRIGSAGWAERFELYWKGKELANAFFEVSDPTEQKKRFLKESALRKKQGKAPVASPEILVSEMKNGFPPCSGIALGLDRLFLALYDLDDLKQIRLFS